MVRLGNMLQICLAFWKIELVNKNIYQVHRSDNTAKEYLDLSDFL